MQVSYFPYSTVISDFGEALPGWTNKTFNFTFVWVLLSSITLQHTLVSQANDITLAGLLPGKLFKIQVVPIFQNFTELSTVVEKRLYSTCGCPRDSNTLRATEPTGSPASVSLLQVGAALYWLYFTR